MAHTATLHCLHIYLDFEHRLDVRWSQASLRGANTIPLEGVHSEGRTGSVSKATAGDCNFTIAKWQHIVSKLQRIRARRLLIGAHGWKGRAVRNAQRVDRITTLQDVPGWSVMPSTSEYALHCGEGGYLPPSDFAAFVEDQTRAKHEAQDAACAFFKQKMPEAAAQMEAAGVWPGLWSKGGGKWKQDDQQRLAGVNLVRERVASADRRPPGPAEVEKLLDPRLLTRMKQADREAEKARAKMAAHLQTEHGLEAGELEADLREPSEGEADPTKMSVAQLAEQARAQYETLQKQLQESEGRRVLDEFGQDVTRLASGAQLRDEEGGLQNTERVINGLQASERVSRDRGRRFMLFALEEERLAASAAGHDCCRGSLLVVRIGLSHVALGRVIRLSLLGASKEGGQHPTSFKLEPGSKKQAFQLELLYPDGIVSVAAAGEEEGEGTDMLQFCSTGRMLPICPAVQVLRMVPCKSLHPIKETVFARMAACDAIALRNDPQAGGLKAWAALEQLNGAKSLEPDLQLPDDTVCFACHLGWSDDISGPLLCCKGGCKRAFHTTCHPHFPLETQICGRCSGEDTDICFKCDLEWSDPDQQSDFYTGEMVGCDGPCQRWFHQQCHTPIISAAEVRSKAKWLCADCTVNRQPAASRQPAANRQPPAAATPITPAVPAVLAGAVVGGEAEAGASGVPAVAVGRAAPPTTAPTADEAPAPAATDLASFPPSKSGWDAVELTLFRSAQSFGFTVCKDTGLVEAVAQGGSGALAGLRQGDVIVGVNDARLRLGEPFASHLSGRQREGSKLTLVVHRRQHAQPTDPSKRQRTARQQPGMQAFDGVRLGDGARTHAERLANTFVTGTANTL